MAKVGAQRAAELTGKSKSTIQRAMNGGKVSFEVDGAGRRVVDVSELERVFGLKETTTKHNAAVEEELEKVSAMLEGERQKMRIKMLEEQLEAAQEQIDDLKGQRDKWEKQATQVLITSQYSQKQADDLREQLKERERRAEQRRQERMAQQQMQRLKAQNENMQDESEDDDDSMIGGFWKRLKQNA